MPRANKSQWDFGDLFATAPARPVPPSDPASPSVERPARQVFSVTELTLGIKRKLEDTFGSIWVSGEVSNLRLQSSGHAYFVLKDANAQLNCVLFRGQGASGRGGLRDGARVTLGGELTVYEPRGQYQLRVTSVELEGLGALQAAFEKLKARLNAEGLFDPARKRPLPAFPRRVGLVTSPTGAAIKDVLHVVGRRHGGIEFVLVPVRVQGQGAADEIAAAIALLNEWASSDRAGELEGGSRSSLSPSLPGAPVPLLDVILITRGGGSLEDLWAFNEEVVARAIAASAVPVISAVGHEIDFTIADFVADLRAATPSAAAEILTQAYVNSHGQVEATARRLRWLAQRRLEQLVDATEAWQRRLARVHPRRQLDARAQRLDDVLTGLGRAATAGVATARRRWESATRRLLTVRPAAVVARQQRELADVRRRMSPAVSRSLARHRMRWEQIHASLRLLAPQSVLDRGYSITFDAASGRVLRQPAQVKSGDRLRTRLAGGDVESVATRADRSGLPPSSGTVAGEPQELPGRSQSRSSRRRGSIP